jgi:hypothetical protein
MAHFTSTYLALAQPYRWLRGNHHGHSTVSDGENSPLDTMRAYEAEGYDYFALSEHDTLLPATALQPHTRMCIIQAVEVTSDRNQTLLYLGADHAPPKGMTPRAIIEHVHASGGLFIFDHPNWRPFPDYATDDLLFSMVGMRGMEIYTGVIEQLPGEARATDRWDRLLGRGWRVFGHATDDQHEPRHYFVAWNQVQWPQDEPVTPQGIVVALSEGRFYASTGVTIMRTGIGTDGRQIIVESDADAIHWITREGVIAKKSKGGAGSISIDELGDDAATAIYVRAECLGHGNAMAWTQPFWIED